MPKATLPFGEWRPDLAQLDNQFASIADNVFPATDCYKPIPSLLAFTASSLGGTCVGLTYARKLDGSWAIYAGTPTGLFLFTLGGWVNLTRTSGGNYNVPSGELWSFTQFGTHIIAVNINDDPQWADIEAATPFTLMSASAPRARNVHTVGDFVVLAGLSTNRRRVRWSAINDPTSFVIGVNLCDEQEFPDGGPVQGVAGNEIGFVMQDRSIRLMQFLPGDIIYIFQFSRVVKDKGSISQLGFTTVADDVYFMAEDGPYVLSGGHQLIPIGQEKVNEWWLANSDIGRRNMIQVVASNRPYVVYAFHSSAAATTYDRLLIFNWAIQRWTTATISAQMWAQLGTVGLDLDTTGAESGDALLDSTAQSLDSFAYQGGRPTVCAVDPQGLLSSLTGPNLPATLETIEAHLVPGMRAFVSEVYPLVDAAEATIAVSTRERLADTAAWTTEVPLEITGSASVLTSSRLHRFRMTIPAGDTWTTGEGVLAEAQPDGLA